MTCIPQFWLIFGSENGLKQTKSRRSRRTARPSPASRKHFQARPLPASQKHFQRIVLFICYCPCGTAFKRALQIDFLCDNSVRNIKCPPKRPPEQQRSQRDGQKGTRKQKKTVSKVHDRPFPFPVPISSVDHNPLPSMLPLLPHVFGSRQ